MIGREQESKNLLEATERNEAQLVVVYGRRRVGKTYLVRETFGNRFYFDHSGIAKGTMRDQLDAFRDSLLRCGATEVPELGNWRTAFLELERFIKAGGIRRKKVLFIDELPWMDTPKAGFVKWFEAFWNGWCSARKDVVLVICGSATSWIVKNVFRNRGGLHNRVTDQILLKPFSLRECRDMCRQRGLVLTDNDIAELYMVFGGIPFYWSLLRKGRSAAQSIDELLFARNGKLRNEFDELFSSLFGENPIYVGIVRALSKVRSGVERGEILKSVGLEKGGNAKRYLDDLERCGFIRRYTAYGKKKRDATYQLIDNFSLFHLDFIDGESNQDDRFWSHSTLGPALNAWRGLAFERICLQHIAQIKAALGVSGVLTRVFSWRHVPDDVHPDGAQIDLLLERADRVIDVCEMKWCDGAYAIDKAGERKLRNRLETFRVVTGTRCAVQLVMVTPEGVVRNAHSGVVQAEVSLDDLFANA
jgi:AAA+ ATPase superfamily predicted ATPase